MTYPYCNDASAVAFTRRYRGDATELAKRVQVPVEFILGVAASETTWGRSKFAMRYNNFFSMETKNPKTKIKFAIGYVPAAATIHDKRPVRVAVFPSFFVSGLSFLDRWGKAVFGVPTQEAFALALQGDNFNSGDAKTGGTAGFVDKLIDAIIAVRARLACPA